MALPTWAQKGVDTYNAWSQPVATAVSGWLNDTFGADGEQKPNEQGVWEARAAGMINELQQFGRAANPMDFEQHQPQYDALKQKAESLFQEAQQAGVQIQTAASAENMLQQYTMTPEKAGNIKAAVQGATENMGWKEELSPRKIHYAARDGIESGTENIVMVNLKAIEPHLMASEKFKGVESDRSGSMRGFEELVNNGVPLKVPSVGLGISEDGTPNLEFNDGRHRTSYSLGKGVEEMPMQMFGGDKQTWIENGWAREMTPQETEVFKANTERLPQREQRTAWKDVVDERVKTGDMDGLKQLQGNWEKAELPEAANIAVAGQRLLQRQEGRMK